MNYIFLFTFVFFSSGVFLGNYLNIHISLILILFILPLLFFGRSFLSVISFLLFCLLAGIYQSPKEYNPKLPKNVFVECRIKSIPETYSEKKSFLCDVVNSDVEGLKNKRIRVIVSFPSQYIFYGTRIAFLGRTSVYKDKVYFFPMEGFLIVNNNGNVFYPLFLFRKWLIQRYEEKSLSQDSFSLGLALIFGEKTEIEEETKEIFIKTGLVHLLAISGFHVGIFIFILTSVFFFLKKSSQRKIILLSLPVYSFLTGMNIPVVRASFFGFVYFLGKSFYLEVNPLNLLFFVAFLISFLFPEVLFSPGFQLSFSATLGILLFLQKHSPENNYEKYVVYPFIISVVATVFTVPVLIYHFGYLSLSGIFLTPLTVPILYVYIFLSALNLFSFFSIKPLVYLMDYTGNLFLQFVSFLGKLSVFLTGFSSSLFFVFIFFILILFLTFLQTDIYFKTLLLGLSLLLFLSLSKEKPAFRIVSIHGKFKPDILVMTEKRECFFSFSGIKNRFSFIMDKYGCLNKKFFSKSLHYNNIDIKKVKKGFLIKRENQLKLFIKNKDLNLSFTKDI